MKAVLVFAGIIALGAALTTHNATQDHHHNTPVQGQFHPVMPQPAPGPMNQTHGQPQPMPTHADRQGRWGWGWGWYWG